MASVWPMGLEWHAISMFTSTVIRILQFGNDNARNRKLDGDLIDAVRHENMHNGRFEYREEVVRDGVGLAKGLKEMVVHFDLMLVGRKQSPSPLLNGLGEWSEFPELGVIGDMLASTDFTGSTTVLVLQQHRAGPVLMNRGAPFQTIDVGN
ncbi:hypothetical protein RJ641_035845 [Dillenia turbinata]|uniref:Uncharacterized protein n=1 Tax=Dillenia turbinata TaxID=194707 RepID=A0AAN8VNQ2_9MAGN